MNSVVGPVNSAWTVRKQCVNSVFCPLHSKIMWYYCLRAEKKKSLKMQNVNITFNWIQTGTLWLSVPQLEVALLCTSNLYYKAISLPPSMLIAPLKARHYLVMSLVTLLARTMPLKQSTCVFISSYSNWLEVF